MKRSLRILGALACCFLIAGTLYSCKQKEAQFPPLIDEADVCFVLTGDPDCFERYYGNAEASLGYMRQLCAANQEYLISVITAFPQILQTHDLTGDPQALDWQLDFQADDESASEELLAVLDEVLANENLSATFGAWHDSASLLYIFVRDAEAELTSANYGLMPVPACIDGHPILCLTLTYADGSQDVGYFDVYTGFQRILPSKTIHQG